MRHDTHVRRTAGAALLMLLVGGGSAHAQQPAYDLDTLRVDVGSRTSSALPVATRGVEVVTAEEIEDTPARTIAGVLDWTLSMDVMSRSPAQADVALRGTGFEQVLVLVDGVRMSDAQTGHHDLDLPIPLDEVERIEVLRGAASALYGSDAMGGVINIVTRRDGEAFSGRLMGGSFGTVATSAAGGVDGETIGGRFGAEARRSDGHRDGTDYRITKARAAIDARVHDRTLRADVAVGARDFGAKGFYTPVDAPFDEYEKTRTTTAALALESPREARFAIEPRLSLRRHDDEFLLYRDDPDVYRNVHTSWRYGGEVTARYAAAPGVQLLMGTEAFRDRLESSNLGDRAQTRAAAFAEIAAGRVGEAAVTAGLRADWHSVYGSFVAPSLSGAFWPADELRLRASTGRAFRAPNWTERFYDSPVNVGDPNLDPERSTDIEIGLDLNPLPTLRLSATGFQRRANALIDWARPTGTDAADTRWMARNVKNATFQGLEFETVADDLLGARWTLQATALSLESEDESGFESRYVLRPVTRSVSLRVERPIIRRLRASIRARHARRAGEASHLRADARLTYDWRAGEVYLDARNLTDAEYLDGSGVPVPGRAFYLGAAWTTGE